MSARYGKPQVIAALLLLCYAAQIAALVLTSPSRFDGAESSSPLVRLIFICVIRAFFPAHSGPLKISESLLFRLPYIALALLLGAFVWYIGRRLFGNKGGYIALTLYAFSPVMVMLAVAPSAANPAATGSFGLIYTAIAVAHTLYAPREVVLWNWRRTLLLGTAIALTTSAEFATVLLVVLAAAFMVYLVPHRKGAAMVILGAAFAIGMAARAIIAFVAGTPDAWSWRMNFQPGSSAPIQSAAAFAMIGRYLLHNGPGFVLLVVAALVAYVVWPRTRFFGTSASLLSCGICVALMLVLPGTVGFPFLVIALPFLFVFVGGVWADLLEAKNVAVQTVAVGVVIAALATHALFSVWALAGLLHTPGAHTGLALH